MGRHKDHSNSSDCCRKKRDRKRRPRKLEVDKIKVCELYAKEADITKIKACKVKAVEVDACKIKSKKVKTEKAIVENFEGKEINVDKITTQKLIIGNIDVTNYILNAADNSNSFGFDNGVKPDAVNQEVYDALIDVAAISRLEYQQRYKEGRVRLNLPENDGVDEVGIRTLVPFSVIKNDEGGTDFITFLATLGFNVDAVNTLDENGGPLLAGILVSAGWIQAEGPQAGEIIIEELEIGNRQFQPSVDGTFGEKYSSTVSLPTSIIQTIANNMPDPDNTGAVQLVMFAETGLEIFEGGKSKGITVVTCGDNCTVNTTNNVTVNANL